MSAHSEPTFLDINVLNAALESGNLLAKPNWAINSDKFYTRISNPIVNDNGLPTYRMGEFFDNDFWVWSEYMTVRELKAHMQFFERTNRYLG